MNIEGISQKGKNRVKEHGNQWTIIQTALSVPALNNNDGILIKSIKTGYTRWMQTTNDPHFKIVKI